MVEGVVVKLGGSLMDIAPKILETLKDSGKNILIVPGGGVFADKVREQNLDDERSHWMAVCSMEIYGWYLSQFGITTTTELRMREGISILLPYISMMQNDPLPHLWDVTSDSIAVWVAGKIGCPLLLIKSVDGDTKDAIDPYCRKVISEMDVTASIINGRASGRLQKYFSGESTLITFL